MELLTSIEGNGSKVNIKKVITWRNVLGLLVLDVLINFLGFNVPDIIENLIVIALGYRIYLAFESELKGHLFFHFIRAGFIFILLYFLIHVLPINIEFGVIILLLWILYVIFIDSRKWFK